MLDAELVSGTMGGDPSAYEELVSRHQNGLYYYVLRIVRDRETARDIAQEAFVKAYVALPSFRPEGNFRTWLFQIGRNSALDHLRRGHVKYETTLAWDPSVNGEDPLERIPGGPGHDPESNTLAAERGEIVRAALDRLPPEYREVLCLRHLDEMAYDEIAAVTGIPLGTVKSKIFRGRDLLRAELAALVSKSPAVAPERQERQP